MTSLDAISFLAKLRDGGEIVSSNDCPTEEICAARGEGRLLVDKDGFGYVYRWKPGHVVGPPPESGD